MQVLLPAFQSVVKALLTSGRSSSRRESQVPRPLESEKTFLLVQVKLSASRKWKLSRLCFVARGVVRLSFPFPPFFLLHLIPRSDFDHGDASYSTPIERDIFVTLQDAAKTRIRENNSVTGMTRGKQTICAMNCRLTMRISRTCKYFL